MAQTFVWPNPASTAPVGGATAANQALEIAQLQAINTNTTGVASAANQASELTQLSAINTNTAAGATSANQVIELSRLSGSLVPTAYNEVDLTYITSGNGTGSVGTAVYKLTGTTVKTLTLTYDSSNRLSTVVAS